MSRPDLSVGTSHDDRTLRRPGQAGDGRRLDELVADHLLLPEVVPDLVNKHDVVCLRNGQSIGFRAEGKSLSRMVIIDYFVSIFSFYLDRVTLLSIFRVGWFRAELVSLLTGIIKEKNNLAREM